MLPVGGGGENQMEIMDIPTWLEVVDGEVEVFIEVSSTFLGFAHCVDLLFLGLFVVVCGEIFGIFAVNFGRIPCCIVVIFAEFFVTFSNHFHRILLFIDRVRVHHCDLLSTGGAFRELQSVLAHADRGSRFFGGGGEVDLGVVEGRDHLACGDLSENVFECLCVGFEVLRYRLETASESLDESEVSVDLLHVKVAA